MDLPLIVLAAVVVVVVAAVLLVRRGGGVVVVPTRPPHGGAASAPGADELGALMARGNKIEAIKLVRERTGWGLKEAKDYVDALEAGRSVAPLPPPAAPSAGLAPPDAALDQAARALVAEGKAIHAIKLVRERTGWGLKEAKDYVDRL